MITIRPAKRADAQLLVSFIEALAEYERLRSECVVTATMLEEQLFGARPAAEAIIGEIDGEPQGFALYFTSFSTFVGKPGIYLEDLFVKPEARGQGLGKALLLELVRIARSRDYGRVEWAVLDWNTPSIEFYKRLGAKTMADWKVMRLSAEDFDRLLHSDYRLQVSKARPTGNEASSANARTLRNIRSHPLRYSSLDFGRRN